MEEKVVNIHYIKNPLYRTVPCDGAIGSVTPLNKVNINFYSTRSALPKSEQYNIIDDSKLGPDPKISEDSKDGFVREIEFGVYLDKNTAEELFLFLKDIFEDK